MRRQRGSLPHCRREVSEAGALVSFYCSDCITHLHESLLRQRDREAGTFSGPIK